MTSIKFFFNARNSLLLKKVSFSAPYQMHGEQYGEYANWCQGSKGEQNNSIVQNDVHFTGRLKLSRTIFPLLLCLIISSAQVMEQTPTRTVIYTVNNEITFILGHFKISFRVLSLLRCTPSSNYVRLYPSVTFWGQFFS